MTTRTLPLRCEPAAGESFPSYVDRLAAAHHVPVLSLLATAGVVREESTRSLPTGYGVVLAPEKLASFAATAGLGAQQVEAMLLRHYDGLCIDLGDVDDANPVALRSAARREWFYSAASHYCPDCLGEVPAWQLAWRLPWTFACLKHERLLVSVCPACHLRAGSGRSDGRTAAPFLTRMLDLGLCRNACTGVGRGVRSPCGFDLSQSEAESLAAWPDLLQAQRGINAWLTDTDRSDRAREYFAGLRSLVALIRAVAGPFDLGVLPLAAHRGWEKHVEAREERKEDRSECRRRGLDWRQGRRQRVWMAVPQDASEMCAILGTAAPIAEALIDGDENLLGERLGPVVDVARKARATELGAFPSWFHFPERLAKSYNQLRSAMSTRFVKRDHAAREIPLDPSVVPKLYWQDRFDDELRPLFSAGMGETPARRFCTLALLRAATGTGWRAAGRAIGLDPLRAQRIANHGVNVVGRENRDAFWNAIETQRARLAQAGGDAIDYRQREDRLAEFVDIDRHQWLEICRLANVHPGKVGSRSRYAAAWLWAQLTSGDWREAPAMAGQASENEREVFRRFVKESLPRIEAALREWSDHLLSDAGAVSDPLQVKTGRYGTAVA